MKKILKAALVAMPVAMMLSVNVLAADAAPKEAIEGCNKEAKEANIGAEEVAVYVNTCLEDAGYAPIDTKSESAPKAKDDKG